MDLIARLFLLAVLQNAGAEIEKICQAEIDGGGGPAFSVAVIKNGEIIHRAG